MIVTHQRGGGPRLHPPGRVRATCKMIEYRLELEGSAPTLPFGPCVRMLFLSPSGVVGGLYGLDYGPCSDLELLASQCLGVSPEEVPDEWEIDTALEREIEIVVIHERQHGALQARATFPLPSEK